MSEGLGFNDGLAVIGAGSTASSSSSPPISDDFRINIKANDTNALPADASTFALTLTLNDTNAVPTETAKLSISTFADTNSTLSDVRSGLSKHWGSGSAGAGVTNPANANGVNDGSSATVQTAAAGPTTETLTTDIGVNVSNNTTFTSVTFRGWYRLETVLATSTAKAVLHSSTAAFADLVLETLSANAGDNNHLTTPFSVDVSATLNTLAKLQSAQLQYSTTDAAAGVSPATVTVDASMLELTGVL